MTKADIRYGLKELKRFFMEVLRPEGVAALDLAIASTYDGGHGGYVIPPKQPLAFKPQMNEELGIEVWVDLFCDIEWGAEDLPTDQDLTLRVWSRWMAKEGAAAADRFLRDREMRAVAKAEAGRALTRRDLEILAALDSAFYGDDTRVVYRCHFDRAGTNDAGPQPGPRFHLQFGGEPRDDEAPWLQRVLSLPRVHAAPTDAILACDMIASNFYPDLHSKLVNEPTWVSVVRQSERMVRSFYEESLKVMDRDGECATHYWDHKRLTEAEAAREAQDGR